MSALYTLTTGETSLFWQWFFTAVAAIAGTAGAVAISVVFHQFVTQGIGPIRWFRPFRFVRVRLTLRREYRQQSAIVAQNERRRHLNAVAGGRR